MYICAHTNMYMYVLHLYIHILPQMHNFSKPSKHSATKKHSSF